MEDDVDLLPEVTSMHIIRKYLLETPSPCTSEDLKNYMSLECSKNFIMVDEPNTSENNWWHQNHSCQGMTMHQIAS